MLFEKILYIFHSSLKTVYSKFIYDVLFDILCFSYIMQKDKKKENTLVNLDVTEVTNRVNNSRNNNNNNNNRQTDRENLFSLFTETYKYLVLSN